MKVLKYLDKSPSKERRNSFELEDFKMKEIIELKDVWFKHPNGRWIFQGINLIIQPTDSIALIGRSKSGKSTLIKLIIGLYQP
mmetsp:Transcript_37721/g.36177  ORF Transcript_37721/g.36177 Transcript_37721/m.36177 type:complete len:83 (+) Transcript_37721:22-270(+)